MLINYASQFAVRQEVSHDRGTMSNFRLVWKHWSASPMEYGGSVSLFCHYYGIIFLYSGFSGSWRRAFIVNMELELFSPT